MRVPLLLLSIASICTAFQTANLQNNFTIGNVANTVKNLVEQLYDPNDLSSCLKRLVVDLGDGWSFTPEEEAAMAEEKDRPREFMRVNSKEELKELIKSRSPALYAATVARIHIVEKILAKLDPEAEQFMRILWEDLLEMFVMYSQYIQNTDDDETYVRGINAFREVLGEYQQLSQAARDSMDEVLCVKSLADAFPTVVNAITTIPEQFDQCMAQ